MVTIMTALTNNNTTSGRNIHKSVWEAAKLAGETTMTYAKWRQAEMAEAKDLELSTFSIDITPVAGTGVLTSEIGRAHV